MITSLQHPLVKHFGKLRVDVAYRDSCRSFILEGVKPIKEVSDKVKQTLYTSAYASVAEALPGEKREVLPRVIEKISGMTSPEGIIAEVAMPAFIPLGHAKRVLALDAVSDPGNMGTLLRTAVAFGFDALCLLPHCCDPFNEKVVRAARGAHFKIALSKLGRRELEQWVERERVTAWVADTSGMDPKQISLGDRSLLVIGNEAHGPSEAMFSFCKPISLPMQGDMESLNAAVAGGILLYLFSQEVR